VRDGRQGGQPAAQLLLGRVGVEARFPAGLLPLVAAGGRRAGASMELWHVGVCMVPTGRARLGKAGDRRRGLGAGCRPSMDHLRADDRRWVMQR
jgi:hypothetical protein